MSAANALPSPKHVLLSIFKNVSELKNNDRIVEFSSGDYLTFCPKFKVNKINVLQVQSED